ncbi:MAG: hypothetical protein EXQ95_11120 [Alphaproteobacteria bacterium]|nr:hypothetical protein [Alphaproteobacteria bacterium]
MSGLTWDRHGPMALANAERNRALLHHGQSIAALRDAAIGIGDSAITIASGPSVARRDPGATIRASGYRGALIAADSAFAYCLRHGLVPDLVVTVDPHPTRIVRWFGDPALDTSRPGEDDYFRRQDLEPRHEKEMRANDETLELMRRHGKGIRIALSTSASEAVVRRVIDIGMDIYWWNPMHDDPDLPESVTRRLFAANGMPCVNAGGNVGTASWMMAHAVLGKSEVALVGFDFSYYADTPHERTQYYKEAVALVGETNLDDVFMWVHNPHLDLWFYTDPAYMWYQSALLDLARDADCRTVNCTEGGIVFGEAVDFQPLASFLARHGR